MYNIYKADELLNIEDKIRFAKLQKNGAWVLCPEEEANGIVINNDYIARLEDIRIEEFDGAEVIADMTLALELLGVQPVEEG